MFRRFYALIEEAFQYKKVWYAGYAVALAVAVFLADSLFLLFVAMLSVGYIELMTRSYINHDIPPIQGASSSPHLSEEGKDIFYYVFGLIAYCFHMVMAISIYLATLGFIEL